MSKKLKVRLLVNLKVAPGVVIPKNTKYHAVMDKLPDYIQQAIKNESWSVVKIINSGHLEPIEPPSNNTIEPKEVNVKREPPVEYNGPAPSSGNMGGPTAPLQPPPSRITPDDSDLVTAQDPDVVKKEENKLKKR